MSNRFAIAMVIFLTTAWGATTIAIIGASFWAALAGYAAAMAGLKAAHIIITHKGPA